METRDVAKVSKNDETKKPKRTAKKQQTVRERTQASTTARPKRLRRTAGRVSSPIGKVGSFIKRKLSFVRIPNNRFGKILRGIGRILWPKFFRNSWREIRQVTWPTGRETVRLTIAVFIFAVVFAAIVGVLDFGLDKLFKEVIVGDK